VYLLQDKGQTDKNTSTDIDTLHTYRSSLGRAMSKGGSKLHWKECGKEMTEIIARVSHEEI